MLRMTSWRWGQFWSRSGKPCSMWGTQTPERYTFLNDCWRELAGKVANKQRVHSLVGQGDPKEWILPSWQQKAMNCDWAVLVLEFKICTTLSLSDLKRNCLHYWWHGRQQLWERVPYMQLIVHTKKNTMNQWTTGPVGMHLSLKNLLHQKRPRQLWGGVFAGKCHSMPFHQELMPPLRITMKLLVYTDGVIFPPKAAEQVNHTM